MGQNVALEAEADVGVDGGGYADAGVVEEFLESDDLRSQLQERGVVECGDRGAGWPGAWPGGAEG